MYNQPMCVGTLALLLLWLSLFLSNFSISSLHLCSLIPFSLSLYLERYSPVLLLLSTSFHYLLYLVWLQQIRLANSLCHSHLLSHFVVMGLVAKQFTKRSLFTQ